MTNLPLDHGPSERRLRRRVFLKALGAGLSIPLAVQFAKMAGAAPTGRPKRIIFYYMPHGVPNEHMDFEPYLIANGDFRDFGKSTSSPISNVHVNPDYVMNTRSGFNLLEPLAPYRSQLSVVRGLWQSGQFGTHDSVEAILNGGSGGTTIDLQIAEALGRRSLFLGAITQNQPEKNVQSVLQRRGGDWETPKSDVVAAYDEVFGGAGPVPPAGSAPSFDPRAATIDLTIGEVERFQTQVRGLTQADDRLSAHLAALRYVKDPGQGFGPPTGEACEARPEIVHIDEFRGVDAAKQPWEPRYWQTPANFEKIATAQAELAAYSVLCGNAQVVTIQNMWAAADFPLPSIDPGQGHHNGISHVSYSGDLTNANRLRYGQAQRWFMERVARMCEILDRPDPYDPDHTALENTIIYVFSEIADGQIHGKQLELLWPAPDLTKFEQIFQYYPALVLGGGGGALKPGSLVTCDNRPIADLLLTLAKAMGTNIESVGEQGTTPFAELLV